MPLLAQSQTRCHRHQERKGTNTFLLSKQNTRTKDSFVLKVLVLDKAELRSTVPVYDLVQSAASNAAAATADGAASTLQMSVRESIHYAKKTKCNKSDSSSCVVLQWGQRWMVIE